MPQVSVIIPIYNVEKYLDKCLDSVIHQTYKELEIICVNDGSTDGSAQILTSYAARDKRIKVVSRKNGGLSAARNSGLDVATGKYCYFIDSDDWIELNTIEKLVNIMTTHDIDVVVHSAINIPEDDSCNKVANDCQKWFNSFKKEEGIYKVPIDVNRQIPPVAWNKLYKTDIINKYHCRFPEGLINEDELFVWTYMIHCRNYYYLHEPLYNYLRRSNSIMALRDNSPKVLDILDIQKEIYKIVAKYKNIDDYKDYLTNDYIKTVALLFVRMPKKYQPEALKRIREYYETVNHDRRILKFMRYKYKFVVSWLKFLEILSLIKRNIRNGCDIWKPMQILAIQCKRLHNIAKIKHIKIVKNKIVFNNMNGKGYGCNPKYIAQEIIRQKLPYELVWLAKNVEKVKDEFPKEIRLVEWTVDNAIKEFASAKVWISNQRMPQLYELGLFKKKEQLYIQTWHAWSWKKVEKDVESEKKWWCKWAKVDSRYIDLLLAASQGDKKQLQRVFYYDDGEILAAGLPRNDIFCLSDNGKTELKRKVYSLLNISLDKNIILYAPTFRDDGRITAYNIDIPRILSAFEKKVNKKFIVCVRLHPNEPDSVVNLFKFNEKVINVTSYSDIQELLCVTDILISDYSSSTLDFIYQKKPIFVFATDKEQYLKERDLYISFEETPFVISESNEELEEKILRFDHDKYLYNLEGFCAKYGCVLSKVSPILVKRIKEFIEAN